MPGTEWVAGLTVAKLKEELKSRGQAVSGKKADLIERLEGYIKQHEVRKQCRACAVVEQQQMAAAAAVAAAAGGQPVHAPASGCCLLAATVTPYVVLSAAAVYAHCHVRQLYLALYCLLGR